MDRVLRENHGRRAEALDDGADIGAKLRAGEQRRRLAQHGVALEDLSHRRDELLQLRRRHGELAVFAVPRQRSEEHTSERQSLMRTSYAVFCLKNKKITKNHILQTLITM